MSNIKAFSFYKSYFDCLEDLEEKDRNEVLNAILNYTGTSLKGSKLYVNLFPCNECAKAIIQSGIKEIIYKEDKYANSEATKVSKKMLELSNVVYRQYETKDKKVILSL